MKTKQTFVTGLVSASALGLVMGLSMSGNANADFISCVGGTGTGAYDIRTKVSTATSCGIADPLDGAFNDVPQPAFVNGMDPGSTNDFPFFGFNDWLFDNKVIEGNNLVSTYFTFTGTTQSGGYTLIGAPTYDFMFVFKDGGSTNLVAYLLPASSGTYSTPFVNPPFSASGSGSRDISHISIYYRTGDGGGDDDVIPEPGVLFLMGAGLLGLGMARRRKSA